MVIFDNFNSLSPTNPRKREIIYIDRSEASTSVFRKPAAVGKLVFERLRLISDSFSGLGMLASSEILGIPNDDMLEERYFGGRIPQPPTESVEPGNNPLQTS